MYVIVDNTCIICYTSSNTSGYSLREVNSLLITIDALSDTPIYQQLKNEIILGIGSGKIKLDERLPTIRQLAADIGVNNLTVAKAYSQLKNEGYIEINRRKEPRVKISAKLNGEFLAKQEKAILLAVCQGRVRGQSKAELLYIFKKALHEMHFAE